MNVNRLRPTAAASLPAETSVPRSSGETAQARPDYAAAFARNWKPGAAKGLDAGKDLEAQDRLGNFEIQDLMSRYNQAETLASSVQKKADDTNNGVASKIG